MSTVSAEVNTLHVEIRALMIGKKQFTISMFKQLYEASIFSDKALPSGTFLLGEPWGVVHYTLTSQVAKLQPRVWGGTPLNYCDVSRWIIWQSYDRLLRCPYPNDETMGFEPADMEFEADFTKLTELPQLFIAV